MSTAYQLLGVLKRYALDVSTRYVIDDWYMKICEQITKDYETSEQQERELEKTLANTIADGLNHGNWPWIKNESAR